MAPKSEKPSRPKKAAPRTRKPRAEPAAKAAPEPPRAPAPPPPMPTVARGWGVSRTLTWLFVMVALAAAIILFIRSRDGTEKLVLEVRVPTQASVGQLEEFAAPGRPVYWIGPPRSGKLEVTRTKDGLFVRYLPAGVKLGDRSPKYTTVATYAVPDPMARLSRSSRSKGAVRAAAPRGGLVVWRASRPTNVYIAYPGVRRLIEVFDRDGNRARTLALTGKVRLVP